MGKGESVRARPRAGGVGFSAFAARAGAVMELPYRAALDALGKERRIGPLFPYTAAQGNPARDALWLSVDLTVELTTGPVPFTMPFFAAWDTYKALTLFMANFPLSEVIAPMSNVVLFGAYLGACISEQAEFVLHASAYERALEKLFDAFFATTDMESLLRFTYEQLRQHTIAREGAAAMASYALRKDISTEAWRKQVDRWAGQRNLPKVGLRKPLGASVADERTNWP